jgi:alkanesulfonate monooxygenase SsuD/methylene tetrahydromethanopterin reductase-like flavin-dependent oxidoreductase (luciferase family)
MTRMLLRQGRLIPVPPPEQATEFLRRQGAANGRPGDSVGGRRGIIGSPETVRAGLEEVRAQYGADEVIAVTITHDHAARKRSYELLAEAMVLEPRPLAAT